MASIRNIQLGARSRPTFAFRRAARRAAARRRVQAHVRQPIDRPPRDPLARPRRSVWRRILLVVGLSAVSFSLHALGVLLAQGISATLGHYEMPEAAARLESVSIQVRDAPPPPPAPEPVPAPVAVTPPKPRPLPSPAVPPPDPIDAATPPPKAEPSSEPPPAPQRRVVGVSYESTVVGGAGPALAVGNTRMGRAAPVADDPRTVERLAPSSVNQRAALVPGAGVQFAKPKRLVERPPPYPEQLRAQGLEADVVVLVAIDPTGTVTRVELVQPAAEPAFNEAARRAALAERFSPATRDGTPIAYTLKFTYRFRLENV